MKHNFNIAVGTWFTDGLVIFISVVLLVFFSGAKTTENFNSPGRKRRKHRSRRTGFGWGDG